jgi:hypothetical protein
MNTKNFIDQAIGKMVYVTNHHDLYFECEFQEIISKKTELRLIKWTKNGNVYLHDEVENRYYTVPPASLREVGT